MKTHQVGAATIAAMCLLLASTRSQTVQLTNPNVRSEGHFFVRDYVLYSDAVVVNFRSNVMRTPKGSQVATMNQVGPEYADVRGQLETLAMRYGGIRIKKQVPNAAWGEVTRTNRRSGAPVQIRDLSQLFILILGSPADIDSLVGALKKIPSVEYAHQPLSIISFADPNDPEFEEGNQWYLTAIDASNAWRITHGSSNVSIAIIDEGVKRNHVDLQGKIIGGDSIEGQHGTWVAGIAAGKTDNETGIASLGWNTKLYTYGDGTSQPMWDWSTIADEISTAAEICDIINLSWGCFKYATLQDVMTRMPNCTDPEKWVGAMFPAFYGEIDAAIDNAVSEGVVCVVAAGNSTKNNPPPGQDPEDCDADIPPYVSYPADNDATIAVSGTELVTGTEQFRDNYNYGAFVDVAAPAIQIRTTEIAGGYAYVNGTSFSAPQVCALVSLILAVNSSLTPSQVRDILTSTADKIDASNHPYDQNGWNECLGYGRINAYKALSKTNGAPSGPTNLTITNTSSTPIHLSWTQNSEPDLASYEVWRKSNSGSWQLIGSPTTN